MAAELSRLLAEIEGSNIEGLRHIWRRRWREPPKVRAGDVLRRAAAERLQEEAYGVDWELVQELEKLARRHRPGKKPRIEAPSYQPGTRLTREWQGVLHEVAVASGGYVWRGRRFGSLSKVAREITGVRWNGPRFFGLRQDQGR